MSKISFQTPGNSSKFKRIHLELANPEANEEDIRLTGSRLDLDMIPEVALKTILAELHEVLMHIIKRMYSLLKASR